MLISETSHRLAGRLAGITVHVLARALTLAVAPTLALGAAAHAAPASSASIAPAPQDVSRPVAVATAIDQAAAPHIDGDISDPVWTRATVINRFYQVEPQAGTQPSERTEVRILYDRDALYVAIHCFDDDPAGIVATVKSRDGYAPNGDYVRVELDPQYSRRNGYAFEITPAGGRTDALIQDNSAFLSNWNVVWEARARIVADGWTAEMKIPFRELSFNPARDRWGFDFIRQIKRKSETIRWAPTAASVSTEDLSLEGTLTGLVGMRQGKGLDVQLYATGQVNHQWGDASTGTAPDTRTTLRPSGTAYYKITPALTGAITVNPDFSDAPLDQRQVNTSRFSLFLPETRQFFLQDAATFQYGGMMFSPAFGPPAQQTTDPNGQPFFSRHIGLIDDDPVGVIAGAKLSGDIGTAHVGVLSVRTRAGQGAGEQTLSVARASIPVLASSTLGVIATNGDPTGLSRNSLAGADFEFLNTDIGGGKRLQADSFYQRSDSSVSGNDSAFGTTLNLPNEPWGGSLAFKQIGTQFTPALGFVNRTGIRQYNGEIRRRTRPVNSYLHWYEFGGSGSYITGLDGALQSRTVNGWAGVFNRFGDDASMTLTQDSELLMAPFVLPGNVIVAAGRYNWVHVNPHLDTSVTRPLSVSIDIDCCRFYNGRFLSTYLGLDYRLGGTYAFHIDHNVSLINMPDGHTDIKISTASFTVNFTPDMQLSAQLQHDNISQRFDMLTRYRWEYQPGQELLVSLGEEAQLTGAMLSPYYHSRDTGLLVRIGHRLQF